MFVPAARTLRLSLLDHRRYSTGVCSGRTHLRLAKIRETRLITHVTKNAIKHFIVADDRCNIVSDELVSGGRAIDERVGNHDPGSRL